MSMINQMGVMSFEPGHVFTCERRGCAKKASRVLTSYTSGAEDLRTVFLCPKHVEEFRELRSGCFGRDERELMAGNIISMLHAVNKLIENGDKLKRALDSAEAERHRLKASKPKPKKLEDEILGGR